MVHRSSGIHARSSKECPRRALVPRGALIATGIGLTATSLIALVLAGCRAASTREGRPSSPSSGAERPSSGPQAGDPALPVLVQVRDLLEAGQADSAIAVLRPSLLGTTRSDPRLLQALVLASSEAGAPWEGVRVVDELMRTRPGEALLLVARGELELARGRPEVALRHFYQAILADDASPAAMGGFGRCRALTGGSVENAIAYFDKLSKAKPKLAAPRYGKAALLLAAGRPAEAVEELRWTLGLDENLWLAERDYGRALLLLEDGAGALSHFEKAVRILDAAGDPLMAERVAGELRAAAEGPAEQVPGEKPDEKGEPQG